MNGRHLHLVQGGPPADEPRPSLPGYAAQMAELHRRARVEPPRPRPLMDWSEVGEALGEVVVRLTAELGEDIGPEPLTPGAQVLALFAARHARRPEIA